MRQRNFRDAEQQLLRLTKWHPSSHTRLAVFKKKQSSFVLSILWSASCVMSQSHLIATLLKHTSTKVGVFWGHVYLISHLNPSFGSTKNGIGWWRLMALERARDHGPVHIRKNTKTNWFTHQISRSHLMNNIDHQDGLDAEPTIGAWWSPHRCINQYDLLKSQSSRHSDCIIINFNVSVDNTFLNPTCHEMVWFVVGFSLHQDKDKQS